MLAVPLHIRSVLLQSLLFLLQAPAHAHKRIEPPFNADHNVCAGKQLRRQTNRRINVLMEQLCGFMVGGIGDGSDAVESSAAIADAARDVVWC